jgi:hypothetical protein
LNRSFQLERLGPDLSHEAGDPFHVEIDYRRCVQRQQLRDAETADDRDAERTPQFRSDAVPSARGRAPNSAQSVVTVMGLNRRMQAWMMACLGDIPPRSAVSAKSIIMMAFFLTMPIKRMTPTRP